MATAQGLKLPPQPDSDTPWNGPDPTLVRVQAILFSSLAVSLLAAFVAMLGKQWLNRYSQVEMHGSLINRNRDRQRKINGMTTWHFNLVMESLPVMLQFALLLLGFALANYLTTIAHIIAWVIYAFTTTGLVFYLFIFVASTVSYDCPFQVPLSLLIHFDKKHRKYLRRFGKWCWRVFSWRNQRSPQQPRMAHRLNVPKTFNDNNSNHHIQLPMVVLNDTLPQLFEDEADWNGYALDSNCIAWMYEMSMDDDVILNIMRFIPEVVWHDGIRTTPLERLYGTVLECFDHSSTPPVVIPRLRNKAYLSSKAFLHLAIQRKCIGNESDNAAFEAILRRHKIIGSKDYKGDFDLESTLRMVDHIFLLGDLEPIRWEKCSFSPPHHAWLSHILLYHAWNVLRQGERLPDYIRGFVSYTLRLEPPPPVPIAADCLFIIGLVLGIKLHISDLLVTDKRLVGCTRPLRYEVDSFLCSREFHPHIDRLFEKLAAAFWNDTSTTDQIDNALRALNLIAPLSEDDIAEKSYLLFHVIMQANISSTYSEEKRWEASRLALHGAYKWDKVLPWVEDPKDILAFLNHHFDLATQGEDQDEPIQNALRALAYAHNPETIEALKTFDPTEPSFVRGICFAFQNDRPPQLRKAALFFLPLVADRWFNTHLPIMEPSEMRNFCADWASAIDEIGPTVHKAALEVLFGMINSSHWRPHIVPDKWNLLEYPIPVPYDFQPLKRCIDNPEVMEAISNANNRDALVLWSTILWLNYNELDSQIRTQLLAVTKDAQKWDLERYRSGIELELNAAEDALIECDMRSWSDPAVQALRTKIDDLGAARDALVFKRTQI